MAKQTYAEQRQQLSQDREAALEHLLNHLMNAKDEAKQGEAMRHWLALQAHQYAYSFNNLCLIYMQKPDMRFVASKDRWAKIFKQAGTPEAKVDDSKGLRICVPMQVKKKDEEGEDRWIRWFGSGCVYDISDISGFTLQDWERVTNVSTPDSDAFYAWCVQRLAQEDCIVDIREEVMREGCYGYARGSGTNAKGDAQSIIRISQDIDSSADKLRILFHEAAHAKIHIGKAFDSSDCQHDRSTAELEAESVAFVTASHFGYDSSDSVFYVASWEGNKKTAKSSLERVVKTAKWLCEIAEEYQIQVDQTQGAEHAISPV